MITSSSAQLDIKFEVFIHNGFLEYSSIHNVAIELSENMHDLAVLEVSGVPSELISTYVDLPISIRMTVARTRVQVFTGYIAYLEPKSRTHDGTVNKSPFQNTLMHCIGASYVMRNRRTNVWNDVTLSQLAQLLARKYNFTVSAPGNTYRFPRLVQSGESDWAVLKKACNYLGYRLSMRGTHIDIWDPFTTLSRYRTAPLYTLQGSIGNLNAEPGQIIDFKALVGGVTPESAKVPDTIHALVNNSVVTLSKNVSTGYGTPVSSIFSDEVAINADSIEMANAVLTGRSRFKFPYTAHITVVGDPAIVPGTVVQLYRYNSPVDGLWIVKSARHEMMKGSAVSYLDVERDSEYTPFVEPSEKVFVAAKPPEPVIVNSTWVTPSEFVEIYS